MEKVRMGFEGEIDRPDSIASIFPLSSSLACSANLCFIWMDAGRKDPNIHVGAWTGKSGDVRAELLITEFGIFGSEETLYFCGKSTPGVVFFGG